VSGEELSQAVQLADSQQGLLSGKSKRVLGEEKRMPLRASALLACPTPADHCGRCGFCGVVGACLEAAGAREGLVGQPCRYHAARRGEAGVLRPACRRAKLWGRGKAFGFCTCARGLLESLHLVTGNCVPRPWTLEMCEFLAGVQLFQRMEITAGSAFSPVPAQRQLNS